MSLGIGLGLTLGRKSGGSAWAPVSAGGVVLWLRADLGITTSGGEVTGWADQSGAGDANRNLTPAGTDRPAYNATDATYNNRPTVGTFNKAGAANDCRLRTGVWNATYGSPLTIVAYGHTAGASNRYFGIEQNAARDALFTNGTGVRISTGSGAAGDEIATLTGQPVSSPVLLIGEFNGASSAIYINATATATITGSLTTSPTLGNAAYNIGSFPGLATSFGVERIGEFIIYNKILSAGERVELRNYINSFWGRSLSA